MPATVWTGLLTFGLVSIPVKLYRAARAEKVSFRRIHEPTGARVKQALYREPVAPAEVPAGRKEPKDQKQRDRGQPTLLTQPRAGSGSAPIEVPRAEVAKGYEYDKDRFVVLTREELEAIKPQTAREMEIVAFVQFAEVDPVYLETSYYAAPGPGGERPYALLFEALRKSGFVGLAQLAMHRREHIGIIRPGRTGIVLHTMFYETEIRREDEYRTDTSQISRKEMDLALSLIQNLEAPFDPSKYADKYREKLDALIAAKLAGGDVISAAKPSKAPVIDIVDALQRSLKTTARKPAGAEKAPPRAAKKRT